MSLIAVMRAVIELRHASLAGGSGLGTTRGYYEALLLDLRDARGVGSVKAIMIHPRSGALLGGVSPTGDSYVMAW